MSEQLSLDLGLVQSYQAKPTYDPYWDELEEITHQHNQTVGEQLSSNTYQYKTVGEQETKYTAHQQNITHFVERYYVERQGKKYWYYRYTWMEGRKMHRKYIGSVSRVRQKVETVRLWILEGIFPEDIVKMISNFNVLPHRGLQDYSN